jgi:hypothetical protein
LEIVPQYRTIKLSDGTYTPNILKVDVFKLEDGKRTLFILNENPNYELLYKNYSSNTWNKYKDVNSGNGVSTNGVSCLEFKLVKNYQSTDPNNIEEIWDYEDVWVVADGRGTHYYYADLGNTESMMVLTTGEKINNCAQLRNDSYSITFNPKFYDGTEEYNSSNGYRINISLGEDIDTHNGTFVYNLSNNTFTVTSVPYGVDMIPITFNVKATKGTETYSDSIPFNIYISTITNIYTLVPSVSAFNTSTGIIDVDVISCAVYKNNDIINTNELSNYGLCLKYKIYNDNPIEKDYPPQRNEGEPEGIKYGEGGFTAKDVGIEFILCYIEDSVVRPVVRSTVPLIKDGINGKDGDSWQYIFCRSDKYPFSKTEISNPFEWYGSDDKTHTDSNEEYIPDIYKYIWFDDHQGVDKDHKYEYQSYRKWNKEGKYWGQYTSPTLYSNYSEDGTDGRSGSGYSVLLSNPVAVIPVSEYWSADKEDSTIVYLYDNVSEIEDFDIDINIDVDSDDSDLNNDHFKRDGHKIIFTPTITIGEGSESESHTFNFEPNTPYKLPIKITYGGNSEDGDFTTTINWTLMPINGLEDVEVFVDKRVVNISKTPSHSITVGYYSISSNGGRTFVGNYDEREKYDIMITNDISSLTEDKIVSNWSGYSLDFSSAAKYFVVLVEKDENNTYNLIDSIDITPISDGKDGSSAIHLELTNDYITVPCNSAGELHEQFTESISSQMILYDGDALITSNDVEYKLTINDVEYYESDENENTSGVNIKNDGTFSIDNSFIYENITGDTHITCTATYNNVPYHKTLFIDFELNPYELELNKQVLVRDVNNGNKITDTLAVRVKYWDSNTAGWVYIKREDDNNNRVNFVKLNGENNFTYVHQEDANDWYWKLDFSDLTDTNSTEFKISYYKNESELSHEYIGVVDSGKNGVDGAPGVDGTTPTNTSVTVLGYSIKNKETCEGAINIIESEIKADNSVWRPSISDWGSEVKPGQTIYILNKHTWVDENGSPLPSTRSISTTMAGTRGVDGTNGKSRVLFYLGSFEKDKATLPNDSIMGHLTPERCDYYIDYNGQAWMRIGQEDIDNGGLGVVGYKGSKDANNNSVNNNSSDNWQKSEIVGFLQAGAIHANMINADTLSTNNAFVEAIQTMTIYADEITGKTIKSGTKISDINDNSNDNDPTWQINNAGGGWLASKNIQWEPNGDLTINGKINGSIGNENDNVIINGDLIINNIITEEGKSTSKPSLILCGKQHPYPNIKIEKNIDEQTGDITHIITQSNENRYIIFASGIYDKLYCWRRNPTDKDDKDIYIPQYIYTKYNIDLIGRDVGEYELPIDELYLYDETKNHYFPFNEFDSASIKGSIWQQEAPTVLSITYMLSLIINNKRYAYALNSLKDLQNEEQIETADTIIFSNGEINTNSILVKSGEFNGTIHSDGDFCGELKNVTGSINEGIISNSYIKNSNIEIYDDTNNSKKIFELNPSLTIGASGTEIKFKDVSWKKQDKDSKNNYVATKNKIIGKIWVPKSEGGNPSAKISLTINVSAYQPRRYDGNDTRPMVKIYWRYIGNTNYSVGHNNDDSKLDLYNIKILQSNWIYPDTMPENGNLNRISESNGGRECEWRGHITNVPIESDKDGEIEILAYFAATLTSKQLLDYPSVNFNISGITVKTTSAQKFENNSIAIGNNGAIILGGDGGQITTVKNTNIDISNDGSIKLMSPNQHYGIIITDKGIILYNSDKNGAEYANISSFGSFNWKSKANILNS